MRGAVAITSPIMRQVEREKTKKKPLNSQETGLALLGAPSREDRCLTEGTPASAMVELGGLPSPRCKFFIGKMGIM